MKLSAATLLISVVIYLLSSVPVQAQSINLLPEGQTLITLAITERVNVAQDTLIAILRIERESADAQTLQREINGLMETALAVTEGVDEVMVETGHYSVYQYSSAPQGGRSVQVWRGSQSIILEGRDAQKILELTGDIQGLGFVMSSLNYTLSTQRADEVRDSLMESAIARATANAERAARAMGKSNVDIAVLELDAALGYAQPMMARSLAMDGVSERASPVAEAGETEVSLTVRIQAVAK
jgi:predicted secreted protein